MRFAIVAGLLGAWFLTQKLLGDRGLPEGGIGVKLHIWMTPLHRYLNANRGAARLLLITSSLGIDALGCYVLYQGIYGPSVRPLLGVGVLMMLRQLSQYLTALPAPEGMIWFHPGVPSFLVTYGVTNDLFFSGHTALAVYGALTCMATGTPFIAALGLAVGIYEVVTVLALRAHWTMDVYAGLVTAVLCFFAFNSW